MSADYPYTNPNAAAVSLLSDAQRKNEASYPAAEAKVESLRDLGESAAVLNLRYARLREKVLKND